MGGAGVTRVEGADDPPDFDRFFRVGYRSSKERFLHWPWSAFVIPRGKVPRRRGDYRVAAHTSSLYPDVVQKRSPHRVGESQSLAGARDFVLGEDGSIWFQLFYPFCH